MGRERWVLGDFPRFAQRSTHPFPIEIGREKVVVHVRLLVGVGGIEGKLAGRGGVLQPDTDPKVECIALVGHASRPVFAAHQSGGHLEIAAGGGAGEAEAQAHLQTRGVDVGGLAFALEQHVCRRMVAQILAHARQIMDHIDAQALQFFLRTHAGQQQRLRGANRPSREDDLAPFDGENLAAALGLHAYGSLALEQYSSHGDATADGDVQPMPGQVQVGQGGAHADSVDVVQGTGRHASRVGMVLVVVHREPHSQTSLIERFGHWYPVLAFKAPHR